MHEMPKLWDYVKDEWLDKTKMQNVCLRNLPYAGDDTNAAIESYRSNLKAILKQFNGRAHDGNRVDWTIYHLTKDVLTGHWFQSLQQEHEFVRNKNMNAQFTIDALLKARDKPHYFVQLSGTFGLIIAIVTSKK